mgnify:CR=1 FL=1
MFTRSSGRKDPLPSLSRLRFREIAIPDSRAPHTNLRHVGALHRAALVPRLSSVFRQNRRAFPSPPGRSRCRHIPMPHRRNESEVQISRGNSAPHGGSSGAPAEMHRRSFGKVGVSLISCECLENSGMSRKHSGFGTRQIIEDRAMAFDHYSIAIGTPRTSKGTTRLLKP